MVEGDFAAPKTGDLEILVHLKLLRKKGPDPEVGEGLSTGPGEEVVGAG